MALSINEGRWFTALFIVAGLVICLAAVSCKKETVVFPALNPSVNQSDLDALEERMMGLVRDEVALATQHQANVTGDAVAAHSHNPKLHGPESAVSPGQFRAVKADLGLVDDRVNTLANMTVNLSEDMHLLREQQPIVTSVDMSESLEEALGLMFQAFTTLEQTMCALDYNVVSTGVAFNGIMDYMRYAESSDRTGQYDGPYLDSLERIYRDGLSSDIYNVHPQGLCLMQDDHEESEFQLFDTPLLE